ncbi:hypothetical protein COL5a_002143 [Colletotrichum fioriniae]|uniref:uncharacterized protein n=1 Tax=Colletotrichum fioriniae TaxID=710243 RepID=UPI0032DBD29C|nr:hypothetical protein COL5a_002143 [Colletotrichum fioriniae]KAJ3946171.1 hypothetical protein N0V96_004529 [Colletotrichum fioriniae]
MSETQLTFGRTDDYIFISKPKKGIAYVEARFKDGKVHKEIPSDMFHSLRVVEFQGLDPSTRVVSVRDVAIKVNLYGCTPESPSESDDELVDILPSATKVDGIWEL